MRSHAVLRDSKKIRIEISILALCLLFAMPFGAKAQSRKPMTLARRR
jgi:hypothetical protein